MSRISSIMVLAIYVLYFVHELRSNPGGPPRASARDVEDIMFEQPQATRGDEPGPRTIRFADQGSARVPDIVEPPKDGIEMVGIAGSQSEERHSIDVPRTGHRLTRNARSGSLNSLRGMSRDASAAERVGLMRSGLTSLHMLHHGRSSMDSTAYEQPVPHRPAGNMVVSVLVLILTSALMSMSAEFLVSTIDDVTHQGGLSEAVIGLIILPIVGNIAEYVTVVTVAARNKLDLAIAVAVGSSIQIALCVTPLTVIAGWIMNRKLALTFNFFEMATLLGTVLLVNLLILNDGSSSLRTSGLKGALMCACYVIIGYAFQRIPRIDWYANTTRLGAYLSPSS
jgi:Ca2+:H+ antiporter